MRFSFAFREDSSSYACQLDVKFSWTPLCPLWEEQRKKLAYSVGGQGRPEENC